MCLSKAFVEKGEKRELVMAEVASLQVKNGKLLLKTLLGEQKEIMATIREIDFLSHSITLDGPRAK